MRNIPRAGQFYRHFKGNLYQIVTVAAHSETGELLVIYQALYGSYGVYARPLEMFLSKVDKVKYPQAEQEYRFEAVELEKSEQQPTVSQAEAEKEPTVLQAETEPAVSHAEATEQPVMPQLSWDAGIEEFLDAGSYQEKLRIFTGMQHRLTDDMIDIMAVSMDTEVNEKELAERIASLKHFLLTQVKYESNR